MEIDFEKQEISKDFQLMKNSYEEQIRALTEANKKCKRFFGNPLSIGYND
jgi:hypothetical protein